MVYIWYAYVSGGVVAAEEFDMLNLDDLWVNDDRFDTPTEKLTDPIPVLFQSGYLTIKGYERRENCIISVSQIKK